MKALLFLGVILATPLIAWASLPTSSVSALLAERPVYFAQDGKGGFFGQTETGKQFTQRVITNDLNVRLHKFTIADYSFYISERGIINAQSDTAALSIYFSLAKV